MKKHIINTLKIIILIFLFINLSSIVKLIFDFIGLDVNTFEKKDILLINVVLECIIIFIIYLFYQSYIKKDIILYKEHLFKNIVSTLKLFGIFILIKLGVGIVQTILGSLIGIDALQSENQSLINNFTMISPVLMVISSSFLAPLAEEGIFRLGLRKMIKHDELFIVFSGLIFGLMHIFPTNLGLTMALLQSLSYVSMGMVLAIIYVRKDNIAYPLIIHALNNLFSIILLLIT